MKLKYLDVVDTSVHQREIIFSFAGDEKNVRISQIFNRGYPPDLIANKLELMAATIRGLREE